MCKVFIFLLVLCWMTSVGRAQGQATATIRVVPEDIAQDSIQLIQWHTDTNTFMVRWAYTLEGAKKQLAFKNAHDGQEVITRIGNFEYRGKILPRKSYPPGWVNDERWLKTRTDKVYSVSEADAKLIIEGLKGR